MAGGQFLPAPVFKGGIQREPYCLRHYRKRLWRWVKLTKEFLPPNEQAMRARDRMEDDAETELFDIDDSRYDCEDGIQKLLEDL